MDPGFRSGKTRLRFIRCTEIFRLWQRLQILDRHCHEQALLQHVDGEDDALRVFRIVDVAFESMQRSADDADASTLGEQRQDAELESGRADGLYVGELAQKR